MDKLKLLSGDELVEKGNQKSNVKLPDLGIKEIFRNGSWLEQKQIQAALEARKDIVEVERIEKSGTLSQANWSAILGLAEVTHKTGGHWQYLGHNKGDKLYIYPEEALFLMEMNCLLLKHNDVVMSLQEAYVTLLQSSIEMLHYKVYSSLGRLGYKVFRHTDSTTKSSKSSELTEFENKINLPPIPVCDWTESNLAKETDLHETKTNSSDTTKLEETECAMDIDHNISQLSSQNDLPTTKEVKENGDKTKENGINCDENINQQSSGENQHNMMVIDSMESNISDVIEVDTNTYSNDECELINHSKIMKLRNRQLRLSKKGQKHYDSIPDLYQKRTVTIKAPAEQYIPKNVFLNLTDYVLNLDDINSKTTRSTQARTSRTYSLADEVSGPHIRRINSSAATSPNTIRQFFPSTPRFQNYNPQFRHFSYCRPRQNFNYYLFHLLFQRPYIPRYQIPPVPPLLYMRFPNAANLNSRQSNNDVNERKRTRDNPKAKHMKSIEDLVGRVKKLREAGNDNVHNTSALKKLINTYNIRYETKLRLNSDYELIDDSVVDTINLDEDEQTPSKKPRHETNFNNFTENLNSLRQLALKLKDLEERRQTNHRHRRALISAIRTFNKSYNAEVFMNTSFEILDQRHITLASSSDSDCVIENLPKETGKKFKNPFNILKRLSEKRNTISLSTQSETNVSSASENTEYPSNLTKIFNKNWLPDFKDFGKAEVVPKNNYNDPVLDHINGEYLLEYLVSNPHKFENWIDLKLSFIESVTDSIQAASKAFKSKSKTEANGLSPIIKPKDCTDMRTVLEKLSIIKNCSTEAATELKVDFDVYNRDVQNFRKTNPPKPHFMIVCINEASNFPPGDEIAAFRAKYNNDATIIFAIVGIGSVQYLQINPMNLPIYLSKETS